MGAEDAEFHAGLIGKVADDFHPETDIVSQESPGFFDQGVHLPFMREAEESGGQGGQGSRRTGKDRDISRYDVRPELQDADGDRGRSVVLGDEVMAINPHPLEHSPEENLFAGGTDQDAGHAVTRSETVFQHDPPAEEISGLKLTRKTGFSNSVQSSQTLRGSLSLLFTRLASRAHMPRPCVAMTMMFFFPTIRMTLGLIC